MFEHHCWPCGSDHHKVASLIFAASPQMARTWRGSYAAWNSCKLPQILIDWYMEKTSGEQHDWRLCDLVHWAQMMQCCWSSFVSCSYDFYAIVIGITLAGGLAAQRTDDESAGWQSHKLWLGKNYRIMQTMAYYPTSLASQDCMIFNVTADHNQ